MMGTGTQESIQRSIVLVDLPLPCVDLLQPAAEADKA